MPAGEVDDVRQQARGVTGAASQRVGRQVEQVNLVRDQPVIGEGQDRPVGGVAHHVDVRPVTHHLFQEHLGRAG